MQNIQVLKGLRGCAKYLCKYIAKVDEKNYVVIEIYGQGNIVTKAVLLNNTRVESSRMGENKERVKYYGNFKGRCISQMEMLHVMLKYPEV